MRDGRRVIVDSDIEILLDSVDCLRLLIQSVRDNEDYDRKKISQTSTRLSETLDNKKSASICNNETLLVKDNSHCGFEISFIPERNLAKTGNDPLFLFTALAELGSLTIKANTEHLPALTSLNSQDLYLSWQITLISDVEKSQVLEIFEWVEDECLLSVTKIGEKLEQSQIQAHESIGQIRPTIVNEGQLIEKNEAITLVNLMNEKAEKLSLEQSNNSGSPSNKAKSKTEAGSIRVGVDKVDSLINLVGELVITQSMLSELGNDFEMSKVERLTIGLEQLLQNTKELQESVMRIRMLPISFAFSRFPRLVHDLAVKTGKEMELVIKGEQTELDKTVMEQIGDPLVHLVRNAADHGIELSEVRIAKGKPSKGTISVDAYHQGGNIVIEINDDGAGINREVILANAVDKGLVDVNAILADNQVYDLLFEPGFSTATEITDISGRGVGMDVVNRNIQALG